MKKLFITAVALSIFAFGALALPASSVYAQTGVLGITNEVVDDTTSETPTTTTSTTTTTTPTTTSTTTTNTNSGQNNNVALLGLFCFVLVILALAVAYFVLSRRDQDNR
jgi:hypothetical protein